MPQKPLVRNKRKTRKKHPKKIRKIAQRSPKKIITSAAIPKVTFFSEKRVPLFQSSQSSLHSLAERVTLPQGYDDHKIVLQVRDPWMLHAYWELSAEMIQRKEGQLKNKGLAVGKWIIRVYEEPPASGRVREDIELNQVTDNWYFKVEHDHTYYVDIGIVASDGSFHSLARSNKVRTPRFGMSSVIDEQWKCLGEEYWELFALSGGFGIGGSSFMETRENFLQRVVG